MNDIRILWEDAWCLVANKPSGLLTQGAPQFETVETRLREQLKLRDAHSGTPYLALPHRLDRPVSGAVLAAKNIRAAKRFGDQFATRKVDKRYLAVLHGSVPTTSGRWEDTMRKIPDRPLSELVAADHPDAQLASLSFEVLAQNDNFTLVEFQLETGRMHQIRLQASSRGHPVLGDWMYGSVQSFGPVTDDARLRAIALHARKITFRHPQSALPIAVSAPVPETWREVSVVQSVAATVIE